MGMYWGKIEGQSHNDYYVYDLYAEPSKAAGEWIDGILKETNMEKDLMRESLKDAFELSREVFGGSYSSDVISIAIELFRERLAAQYDDMPLVSLAPKCGCDICQCETESGE